MKILAHIINKISFCMQILSGIFLIGMMMVTLFDVISRTLFGLTDGAINLTFIGAVELVKFSLLFTILFTLPHSVKKSQVIVDLFTESMSSLKKKILEAIYLFGFALLGAGMSYQFYLAITHSSGETTQDLMIPLHWIYYLVIFATSMLTLRCIVAAFEKNEDPTELTSIEDEEA